MKTVRLTLFLIIIQLALLLQFVHYYIYPIKINPICSATQVDASNKTKGNIIDCIVCFTPEKHDFYKQILLAQVGILRPDSTHNKTISRLLSDVASDRKQNSLKGVFYSQKQHISYECPTMLFPEDLYFSEKQHQNQLYKYGIQAEKQIQFYSSNSSLKKKLYDYLMGSNESIVESNYISLGIQSMMIRFRYTTFGHQETPIVFIHLFQHHIFIRIILVIVIFLEVASLLNLLAQEKLFLKIGQIALLFLSFVTYDFALAAGVVAIYLTLFRIFERKIVCFLVCIGFGSINTYLSIEKSNFIWIAVVSLVYLIYLCYLENKVKSSCSTLCLFAVLAFNIYYGWVFRFKFLIFITPLHILGGLLLLRIGQKQIKRTQVYDLIRFNDQQEDIMSRIQRQLEGK